MKKKYSKPLFIVIIGVSSISCLVGLLHLSGCNLVFNNLPQSPCIGWLNIDGNEIPYHDDKGELISVKIEGPDELLPCSEVEYTATAVGQNLIGKFSGTPGWVVEGNAKIVNPGNNPVTITGTGIGPATLSLIVDTQCEELIKTLATKKINFSIADLIDISKDACIDSKGNAKLQLINKSDGMPVIGITESMWSVTDGNATVKSDPNDKTVGLISDATADMSGKLTITVSVQVTINNDCKSDNPLSFQIEGCNQ